MANFRISLNDTPVWVGKNKWACRRHCPAAYFPSSVETCLYGCGVDRPPKPDLQESKPELQEPKPKKRSRTQADLDRALIEKALRGFEVGDVGEPEVAEPEPTELAHLWDSFDLMGQDELKARSIRDLRKYATHSVGILRASKIRGGKAVLIRLILAKRAA